MFYVMEKSPHVTGNGLDLFLHICLSCWSPAPTLDGSVWCRHGSLGEFSLSYYSYFPENLNILCVLILHMEQHVHRRRSKDICEGPKRKQKQRKDLTGRIKPLFRGFQAFLGLACLPVQRNSFITIKMYFQLPSSLYSSFWSFLVFQPCPGPADTAARQERHTLGKLIGSQCETSSSGRHH